MAFGFKNKCRLKLEGKETSGFFNIEDLRESDEALIYAVALHDEGLTVLRDWKKVVEIAEEYAHGGIRLLDRQTREIEYGSFWKKFEMEILQMEKEIK